MNWLIDFDDTLVSGPITYALNEVFPRFVEQNNLPYDEEKFRALVLQCQEISSQTGEDERLLQELFQAMNWSQDLQHTLIQDVFERYTPVLYADAIPFLERLRQQGHTLYILSNNNHAPELAAQMNIAPYFTDMFTPELCGVKQGKPHADIWRILLQRGVFADATNLTIIGDDPWSEGLFSERCGLTCWILDRLERFGSLYASKPYHWARTLDDVTV